MSRFYVSPKSISSTEIIITGQEAVHVGRVLRKKAGHRIEVFDGRGRKYKAIIKEATRKRIIAEIIDSPRVEPEPGVRVHLFQGMTKGFKFEFVLQKGTEIGVSRFTPILTERTVIKPPSGMEKRLSRWQRIVREACKQSGRGKIPRVDGFLLFKQALSGLRPGGINIILWEKERATTLKSLLKEHKEEILGVKDKRVGIFIGPEGGFTQKEVSLAREKGVIPATLGHRILRAETAALVVVSLILYEWEA